MPRTSLDSLPVEVRLAIVSELALLLPQGPPSVVFTSLALTCKTVAGTMSSPHAHGSVFSAQFDVGAPSRRLPSTHMTPSSQTAELKQRWTSLKRIKWAGERGQAVWGGAYPLDSIREDMWTAFLLILENDGKNWDQLVGWADLRSYVYAYVQWDLVPASLEEELPDETEERALGLWLLWFLSDRQNTLKEMDRHPQLHRLVVPWAFSWYAYASTHAIPWYTFTSKSSGVSPEPFPPTPTPRPLTPRPNYNRLASRSTYFNHSLRISYPLLSQAAINLFFGKIATTSIFPIVEDPPVPWDSRQYDTEWAMLTSGYRFALTRGISEPFSPYVPGTLTGIFEGKFVLPDAMTLAELEGGAPPMERYSSAWLIEQHQTWKIEEHIHVPSSTYSRRQSSRSLASTLMPPGDPMRAHLPRGARVSPFEDGVKVWTPENGLGNANFYQTWREDDQRLSEIARPSGSSPLMDDDATRRDDDIDVYDEFVEIVVTGEALDPIRVPPWRSMMDPGSFARGTIRKRDGLIVLRAKPAVETSGQWIYIGRVTPDGTWTGRWRALQDTPTSMVWEGIFQMRKLKHAQIAGDPQAH